MSPGHNTCALERVGRPPRIAICEALAVACGSLGRGLVIGAFDADLEGVGLDGPVQFREQPVGLAYLLDKYFALKAAVGNLGGRHRHHARFPDPDLPRSGGQEENQNQSGQGLVEYGLIIGLIAIIVIAVFVALGPQIKVMWAPSSPETAPEPTATQ